jgi:uncharacterized membrane protein
MPTNLDLINFEQAGNVLFIISSLLSILSGLRAEQVEIENQKGRISSSVNRQNKKDTTSNGTKKATVESIQFALDSTLIAALCYVIFIIVAMIRTEKLEQENMISSKKTSIWPIRTITFGFIVSLIGAIIRVPAIQERLAEAQVPVIL